MQHVNKLSGIVAVTAMVVSAAAGWGWCQEGHAPRVLAPGVLTVIPAEPNYSETVTGPRALPELTVGLPELVWQPNYEPLSQTVVEQGKQVELRRSIWNLEFAFKPLGLIDVDVPQPSGKMQRKPILYLVYRVRYSGGELDPKAQADAHGHAVYDAARVSREGRFFFPMLILESHEYKKSYLDRIIPAAMTPVSQREKPEGPLHDSVSISREPIPLSSGREVHDVWGVATWEDIDPRIDYFSIYVLGLTNAYKPVDAPDGFKPGDPPGTGRTILSKALQLNFWRPGDAVHEHETEYRFGIPVDPDVAKQAEILRAYGLTEHLDYLWTYR